MDVRVSVGVEVRVKVGLDVRDRLTCSRVLRSSIGEVTALVTAEQRPPARARRATRPKLRGTSLRMPPVMAVGIVVSALTPFLVLDWLKRGRPSGAFAT